MQLAIWPLYAMKHYFGGRRTEIAWPTHPGKCMHRISDRHVVVEAIICITALDDAGWEGQRGCCCNPIFLSNLQKMEEGAGAGGRGEGGNGSPKLMCVVLCV